MLAPAYMYAIPTNVVAHRIIISSILTTRKVSILLEIGTIIFARYILGNWQNAHVWLVSTIFASRETTTKAGT
jgi:hypothetical protein